MWIVYEIAECVLTAGEVVTDDIREMEMHVREMAQHGVRPVKRTNDHDKEFLTSWLELLVRSLEEIEHRHCLYSNAIR